MGKSGRERRVLSDRRKKPTSPFSRYILLGRRRSIRRRTDRKTHLYVDLYGHYLLLFLLLIILLSVLDAYFTIFHIDRGAQEINPFMDFLLGYGNMYFFIVKYVLTALGLLILCVYKNLLIVKAAIFLVFLFYLGVFANHILLIMAN